MKPASLQLPYKPPLDWEGLSRFLVSRGATGVECLEKGRYWRSLRIGKASGWVSLRPAANKPALILEHSESLQPVQDQLQQRMRMLFDLDADPTSIRRCLVRDPVLKPLLRARPGLRVPGAVDGFELALRAVLGQQISVKAATTVFGRIVTRFGKPAPAAPVAGLSRLTPSAEALASATLEQVIAQGLTRRRAQTVLNLAQAVACQGLHLEPGVDLKATREQLLGLPGIGPWTASYVAMRALADADAFPEADLGLLKALGMTRPRELLERAEGWRPWRAYAALLLWSSGVAGG